MEAMPRYDDKITAFHKSVTREPSGRKVVRTSDFVRNLAELNHHLSLAEANRWVRTYARTYRDASTYEGEDRIWFQFNPNGGI
nr:MAG TPA: hypothetical protein [Caudoviricetes sp.]